MPTKTEELVSLAAKGDKNALAQLYTTNFKNAYFPACGLFCESLFQSQKADEIQHC